MWTHFRTSILVLISLQVLQQAGGDIPQRDPTNPTDPQYHVDGIPKFLTNLTLEPSEDTRPTGSRGGYIDGVDSYVMRTTVERPKDAEANFTNSYLNVRKMIPTGDPLGSTAQDVSRIQIDKDGDEDCEIDISTCSPEPKHGCYCSDRTGDDLSGYNYSFVLNLTADIEDYGYYINIIWNLPSLAFIGHETDLEPVPDICLVEELQFEQVDELIDSLQLGETKEVSINVDKNLTFSMKNLYGNYSWTVNGPDVSETVTNVEDFTLTATSGFTNGQWSLTYSEEGVAPGCGRSGEFQWTFAAIDDSDSLSTAAIAGIAVGGVVLLGGVCVIIYLVMKKKDCWILCCICLKKENKQDKGLVSPEGDEADGKRDAKDAENGDAKKNKNKEEIVTKVSEDDNKLPSIQAAPNGQTPSTGEAETPRKKKRKKKSRASPEKSTENILMQDQLNNTDKSSPNQDQLGNTDNSSPRQNGTSHSDKNGTTNFAYQEEEDSPRKSPRRPLPERKQLAPIRGTEPLTDSGVNQSVARPHGTQSHFATHSQSPEGKNRPPSIDRTTQRGKT